jgi:DNA-binding transcriptional regulator YdaS (Cro superfamily)
VSLKQVIGEWFAGGRQAPRGPLGALIDEAKRLAGGGRAAARALGLPESTLRSWASGRRHPKNAAAAADRVTTGIRRLMLRDDRPANIVVTISPPPRKGPATRSVAVDRAALDRAAQHWVAGDQAGMVRAFRAGITDTWYRERLFRRQDDDDYDDDDTGAEEGAFDPETSEPYVGGIA